MADNTKIATIKLRRATTEAWAATDYVPEDGEPCVEITTDGGRKLKIGDGKTAWGNRDRWPGARHHSNRARDRHCGRLRPGR